MVVYVVMSEWYGDVEVDSVWFTKAGAQKYINFQPVFPVQDYWIREFEVQEYEEVDDS